ncbi:hypothetical protein HDV04_004766 [Boothiomyces sp. JEL0838]|nr:hypothetical protein HDV04_004766 [Boothiomyces sp. JEL0838]
MNLFSLGIFASVFALQDGSPLCNFNVAAMEKGMGPSSPLGYSVHVSKVDPFYNIQLVHPDTSATYQGVLIYVTSSTNPKSHLGNFTAFDTSKFKNVSPKYCVKDGVHGIHTATITHSKPSDYVVGTGTSFTWTPNAGDFDNGDLNVTFVVADFTPDNGNIKVSTWQQILDIKIPK